MTSNPELEIFTNGMIFSETFFLFSDSSLFHLYSIGLFAFGKERCFSKKDSSIVVVKTANGNNAGTIYTTCVNSNGWRGKNWN